MMILYAVYVHICIYNKKINYIYIICCFWYIYIPTYYNIISHYTCYHKMCIMSHRKNFNEKVSLKHEGDLWRRWSEFGVH